MDLIQTAAVATANAVLPGSGIIVNSAFELGKLCSEIAELLTGMQETASSIKTQSANIEKDVAYFRWVLQVLERVHNKDKLTTELQKLITRFETEVKEYDRVMKKFLEQNILKQLVFHSDLDTVSASVKETADHLVQCVTTECAINGSVTYGPVDRTEERANRYMKFIDSPELINEMSDPDNQKEILAIIARKSRRNDAMMQMPRDTNDSVVDVMKEKLWASSSRAVRADISNLPDWYMTEDEVDIDMSKAVGFGGDAKIYRGVLKDGTPVAVKVYNANVKRSEEAKRKFVDTMNLWVRLSHFDNICRLYGACYFTATPFIVMEYCELGSLDTYLRREGVDRGRASLETLAQAARAITKMHSKGIVHGDLKCDNILITGGADPQAKVCDFDRSFDWSALKSKRLVNGTAAEAGIEITDAVRYLAPECVEGLLPNSKSDVYSFGMTLYHALAGVSPYSDISCDDELRACKLARELPSRNVKTVSDGAWELIAQCCDPVPDGRPTMDKVLEALKSLVNQLPVEILVNATMGVGADQIKVRVPTDETPVKSATKTASRVIPKKFQIGGAVILAVVAIGVIVGIVVGMKPSSSSASSSTGSGSVSSLSGSSSGSAAGSSLASSSSDSGSGYTPTLVGRQVSTILTFTGDDGVWGIAVASDEFIYLSARRRLLRMTSDDYNPTRIAGSLETTMDMTGLDGALLDAILGREGPLALGPNGDLFLGDSSRETVRKINSTDVSTLASVAYALVLQGIAVDSSDNVYVSRLSEFDVVKITPDGSVSVFANSSMFTLPMGIAIDSSDNIYITDQHRILKFTLTGEMSVVAGGTKGFLDAVGEAARFSTPWAVTIGSDGALYVVDSDNHCIRKVNVTTTEVTTYAGNCTTSGSTDGLAADATFEMPVAIAAAVDNMFYVADGPNRVGVRLRKIFTT